MARPNIFFLYSTLFLVLSAFTSAWPKFLPDLEALVVRQQNSNSGSASITAAPQSAAPQTTGAKNSVPNSITSGPAATGAASGSGSRSGSGAASGSGSNQGGKVNITSIQPTYTDKTEYDPRLPAGGITMLTPAPISGSQYYKIGDHVTWAWNYTSLSATPTALNILASCANQNLYTLASNQTIQPTGANSFTWDTNPNLYSATPLIQATCTLIMYDADSTISAAPEAGYLAVFNSFQFGMYFPQSPTDSLNGAILCATCSGAVTAAEAKAWTFMLGMTAVTVLSFTWFVGGLRIIW